jgi:hypothetical protein
MESCMMKFCVAVLGASIGSAWCAHTCAADGNHGV